MVHFSVFGQALGLIGVMLALMLAGLLAVKLAEHVRCGRSPSCKAYATARRSFLSARDELARFIRRNLASGGWRVVASPTAPSTWDALKSAASKVAFWDARVMTVWDGASEGTIYRTARDNHAYRAWHDLSHLALGADFSLNGETRVGAHHARVARSFGLGHNARALLTAETIGQNRYFARWGRFPVDQRAFAWAAFNHGLDHAVKVPGL